MGAAARDIFERLRDLDGVRMEPFKVAATGPLKVYLSGGSVQMVARGISGQTLIVGDTGTALYQPGRTPLCIKTTT